AMEGNPFDEPTAPSGKLSLDEYQAQLYRRLNRGDRPEDIMAWSREVGREIVPNEEWVATLAARDAALANNQPGQYGRVITMQPGERAPGSTVADAGAIVRRAGNAPLFYFGDEAVAAGMALAQDGDFWKQYEDNWRRLNAQDQVDETVRPGAVLAGDVAGIGLSMMTPTAIYDKGVKLLMPQTAGRGANLGIRSAVGAGTGAATGATAATGEGSVDDRFQFTEGGAAVGAGFGAS